MDVDSKTKTDLQLRTERLNRWRKPLSTRRERIGAWLNMIWADHGFLRVFYLNFHRISDRMWRSAQPAPYQIRRMARAGLKSVVNLRGGQSYGSLPLEIEACEENGLHFENFVLRSRDVPSVEDIHSVIALFERLEYPVLFHCKSGADRAGMMSALFLALHEGQPVAEARKQLSPAFGHIRHGKTGVLDAFFDAYEADHPNGEVPLATWIDNGYDRAAVMAGFRASSIGTFLTETLLRRE